MAVNARTLAMQDGFEQCRLTVYADSGGRPTVGWGHLVLPEDGLRLGDTITQAQADAFQVADLAKAEGIVQGVVGSLDLDTKAPDRYGVLVDFAYNTGEGISGASTLYHAVLSGQLDVSILTALLAWVHDNGKVENGLIRRRAAECALWIGAYALCEALTAAQQPLCSSLYAQYANGAAATARWLLLEAQASGQAAAPAPATPSVPPSPGTQPAPVPPSPATQAAVAPAGSGLAAIVQAVVSFLASLFNRRSS